MLPGNLRLGQETQLDVDIGEMPKRPKRLFEQGALADDRESQPVEVVPAGQVEDRGDGEIIAIAAGIERPDGQDIEAVLRRFGR